MGGEVFLKSKQNRAGEGGNDLINRRNVSENAEHRGKLEVQRTLKYPPGGIGKVGRRAEGGRWWWKGGRWWLKGACSCCCKNNSAVACVGVIVTSFVLLLWETSVRVRFVSAGILKNIAMSKRLWAGLA